MARSLLIDELHIHVYVRDDLPEREYRAISRALAAPRFREALRRSLRTALQRFPSLDNLRVVLSR